MRNTAHMKERMVQRNFSSYMVQLIIELGSWTPGDRLVLTEKPLRKAIREMRKEICDASTTLRLTRCSSKILTKSVVEGRRRLKVLKHILNAMQRLLKKLPAALVTRDGVFVTVFQVH